MLKGSCCVKKGFRRQRFLDNRTNFPSTKPSNYQLQFTLRQLVFRFISFPKWVMVRSGLSLFEGGRRVLRVRYSRTSHFRRGQLALLESRSGRRLTSGRARGLWILPLALLQKHWTISGNENELFDAKGGVADRRFHRQLISSGN